MPANSNAHVDKQHEFPMAPWSFDGHGINDREGQRICKVSCAEPYLYDSGTPVRNEGFDKLNALLSAAPELLTALEGLFEHCAMIHKHWGENSNQREADAAIAAAQAAMKKARGEQ